MFLVVKYLDYRKEVNFSIIDIFANFSEADALAKDLAEKNLGKDNIVNFINEDQSYVYVNTLVCYTTLGLGTVYGVMVPDSLKSKIKKSIVPSPFSSQEKYDILMEKIQKISEIAASTIYLDTTHEGSLDKWIKLTEDWEQQSLEEKVSEIKEFLSEWHDVTYKEMEYWLGESNINVELCE